MTLLWDRAKLSSFFSLPLRGEPLRGEYRPEDSPGLEGSSNRTLLDPRPTDSVLLSNVATLASRTGCLWTPSPSLNDTILPILCDSVPAIDDIDSVPVVPGGSAREIGTAWSSGSSEAESTQYDAVEAIEAVGSSILSGIVWLLACTSSLIGMAFLYARRSASSASSV